MNYYQPSGKFSPISPILFVVLCLTAFPLLGGLYTYAIWYVPIIYVNFLITATFAFCIGFLMKTIVVRVGKMRNINAAIALCVMGGFVGIYSSWVVWADLLLNSTESIGTSRMSVLSSSTNFDEMLAIAQHPKLLFELMSETNEYGTWAIFGFDVKGVFLWIIWVLEAIVILIGSIMIGTQSAKNPFCERSNKWFKETDLPPTSYIFSKPDLVQELERGSDRILSTLTLHDVVVDNASYSQFTVFSSDHDQYFLTAINMKKMVDTKGEVEYEEDEVITQIEISSKILSVLENVKKKERESKDKYSE